MKPIIYVIRRAALLLLLQTGYPLLAVYAQVPVNEGTGTDPLREHIDGADFRTVLDYRVKVIETEGRGASGASGTTMAMRHVKALEEARRVAYLRLAESIGNMRVEGTGTLSGMFLIDSEFVTYIHQFIRGARIVDERVSFLEDGSALGRVRLRLFLTGDNGLTGTLWRNESGMPRTGTPPDGRLPRDSGRFSGVILWTNGEPVILGLAPRLVLPDGTMLFSWKNADGVWLRKWGAVEYVTDKASAAARVGENPLILPVRTAQGTPDFILDPAFVREYEACPSVIWHECRVAVLLE